MKTWGEGVGEGYQFAYMVIDSVNGKGREIGITPMGNGLSYHYIIR